MNELNPLEIDICRLRRIQRKVLKQFDKLEKYFPDPALKPLFDEIEHLLNAKMQELEDKKKPLIGA